MTRCFSIAAALSLTFTLPLVLRAEDDLPKQPESSALMEAREHMSEFSVNSSTKGRDATIEMLPNPLLTYGDAARNNEAGTLWAWGKSGRPVAFLELYRSVGQDQPWVHALTLTSPELIQLQAPTGPRWTPKKSHFALKDVPNSSIMEMPHAIRGALCKRTSQR